MKTIKTTFEIDGMNESCYETSNSDKSVLVRISTCYHYLQANTLFVSEYIDGECNSQKEIDGDFKKLTAAKAEQIAKRMSVYLR